MISMIVKTGLGFCSLLHSALKILISLQFRYQAFLSGSVIGVVTAFS